MPALHAFVLGVVQGLTEFVPVSSSGHLVVVPAALGWPEPGLAFDVLLHAASLIALLIYFSGDLIDLVRGFLSKDPRSRRLLTLLLIGTVPAAVAGIALGDYFERSFNEPRPAAVQLAITAVILVAGELALAYHSRRVARTGGRLRTINDLGAVDAGAIGIAQAISILPGISRSGSTIAAGLGLSVNRDDAARFAFLLAIPALAGAVVVKVPDLGGTSLGLAAALSGFFASLVFSYAAIAALIRYLKRNSVYPFAAYCVVAAVVFYLLVD
ncbi:MAG TPA: undecaprenyl-diphosphate phosphatase [Actinomycetota bacterium]|nr:undecaprenyl-diphosphate phosphatase [Actinomycetota bacterium]